MAKNEEMKTEFEVFKDVWNVYKKFYFVTDNNEFWDELVNECERSGINTKIVTYAAGY